MTFRNTLQSLVWLFAGIISIVLTNTGMGEDLGNDLIVNDRSGIGVVYDNNPSNPYASVLVTGKDSILIVDDTAPDATGSLFVTDHGTVNMKGTGQLTFNGNAVFDNGYLEQAEGSVLNADDFIRFDNGTIVTSAGTLNAVGGVSVKNHSALNVAGANGNLIITGDSLAFDGTSTLGITIGKVGNVWKSGWVNANGVTNAIDLKGNLLVTPEYDYYGDGTIPIAPLTIIEAANGFNGSKFDDFRLSQSRLGMLGVDYSDPEQVVLSFTPSATPFSSFTQTSNERRVGETFDAIHQTETPLANFESLMSTMWNMSDAELRALYNDLSGEIRAETMAMPLASPGRMAFDRVGWDSANGHVFFGPQYRLAARGSNRATWFRPYYLDNKTESDDNASGYTREGYGFTAGCDQALVGGKTAVGVMLGYGRPELRRRNDKAKLDDFLIGASIATRVFDAWEIKAWGGYGYQYYDMQRQVHLMGTPQTFKSNFKGHTTTLSGELARPIYTMSRLVLKPTVGYDGLFLTQDAGDETGHQLAALSYHKTSVERHIGRLGVNAEYGDSARSLYGGAHYKYLLGGDQVFYSQASFAGGGPSFLVEGVDLGKAFLSANIGLQINLSDDRSRLVFVDYTADFGDNSAYYQMATVGLQQTF